MLFDCFYMFLFTTGVHRINFLLLFLDSSVYFNFFDPIFINLISIRSFSGTSLTNNVKIEGELDT